MRPVLVVALLWVVCALGYSDENDYTLVTEEWAPYNYTENGKLKGISVDIVEAVMEATNRRFKILVLPTMRSTATLRAEPKTIMFSLFRTKEREALYQWVGPLIEESIFPYRLRQQGPLPRTWDDLRTASRITTRVDGLVVRQLQAQGVANLDPVAIESEQLYKMLFLGRAEIIVGDTDTGVRYYTEKLGYDPSALEKVPVEVVRSALYIAFSLDCERELVSSWSSALKTLKDQGTIDRIVARYLR